MKEQDKYLDDLLNNPNPILTEKMINSVRSLACAMDIRVNAAMDYFFALLPYLTHPTNVCSHCDGKYSCGNCYFNYPRVPSGVLSAFAKLRDTSLLLVIEEDDSV